VLLATALVAVYVSTTSDVPAAASTELVATSSTQTVGTELVATAAVDATVDALGVSAKANSLASTWGMTTRSIGKQLGILAMGRKPSPEEIKDMAVEIGSQVFIATATMASPLLGVVVAFSTSILSGLMAPPSTPSSPTTEQTKAMIYKAIYHVVPGMIEGELIQRDIRDAYAKVQTSIELLSQKSSCPEPLVDTSICRAHLHGVYLNMRYEVNKICKSDEEDAKYNEQGGFLACSVFATLLVETKLSETQLSDPKDMAALVEETKADHSKYSNELKTARDQWLQPRQDALNSMKLQCSSDDFQAPSLCDSVLGDTMKYSQISESLQQGLDKAKTFIARDRAREEQETRHGFGPRQPTNWDDVRVGDYAYTCGLVCTRCTVSPGTASGVVDVDGYISVTQFENLTKAVDQGRCRPGTLVIAKCYNGLNDPNFDFTPDAPSASAADMADLETRLAKAKEPVEAKFMEATVFATDFINLI
jgi:hypothetical protein